MKTLNKLIKDASVCEKTDGCYSCRFMSDYEGCELEWGAWVKDALYYLKQYKKDKDDLQDIMCDYVALKEYYANQQENPPLTWEELKQMEGKPVFIESDNKGHWNIIREVTDCHVIFEIGMPYHKCWQGNLWQAYRKEIMKTLDEVIKALECCCEIGLCEKVCPYHDNCYQDQEKKDALYYLKEYKKLKYDYYDENDYFNEMECFNYVND